MNPIRPELRENNAKHFKMTTILERFNALSFNALSFQVICIISKKVGLGRASLVSQPVP